MTSGEKTPSESKPKLGPETSQSAAQAGADLREADMVTIPPRLDSFYADKRIKSAQFVKSVKAAKIRAFEVEDIIRARESLVTSDPTLDRTLSLVGRGSDPITRWIWEAANSVSQQLLGPHADEHETSNSFFERIVRSSSEDLNGKDKLKRQRARNLLRLTVVWLIDQRNLNPAEAFKALHRTIRTKIKQTDSGTRRTLIRLLQQTKFKQLQDFAVIANLSEATIEDAERERRKAVAQHADLQRQVSLMEEKLRSLTLQLESALAESKRTAAELAASKQEVADQRDNRLLEGSKLRGRFRSFLIERIRTPLTDATHALEFKPPENEVAQQRIEMALKAIREQLERSND